MSFEGDDENTNVPDDMFAEGEDEATLVPVFVGHRMEAELIRSLLEANDVPAVVFGTGGFTFGAEDVGPNERVMVRSDRVEAALDTVRDADVSEGVVEPTADDAELITATEGDRYEFEDDAETWADPTDVEVLAQGSDWGPRIVGIIGIAALVIAIVVLVLRAN